MKLQVATAAVCAALAVAGVAAGARAAQPAAPASSPVGAGAATAAFGDTGVNNTLHISTPRKTLQWDSKGRWGLKLDYQQPAAHDTQWQSIDAGGFYKLTPRLQLGATVGLADQPDPRVVTPEQTPQPRVRLETTFKF